MQQTIYNGIFIDKANVCDDELCICRFFNRYCIIVCSCIRCIYFITYSHRSLNYKYMIIAYCMCDYWLCTFWPISSFHFQQKNHIDYKNFPFQVIFSVTDFLLDARLRLIEYINWCCSHKFFNLIPNQMIIGSMCSN